MKTHQNLLCHVFSSALVLAVATAASAQTAETFRGTASVKPASGAPASAPITIEVTRTMTQAEADKFTAAFTKGGVAALRKALTGVAPTGSIQIGTGAPTPTRLTLERASDRGRLLTIVTDRALMFLPVKGTEAKPKEGFDFGIVDLVIDAKGGGTGTMSPAAKVTVKQGVFVVEEFSGELVQLADLKKVK